MSSTSAYDAELIVRRGIAVFGVKNNHSKERYTKYFGQFAVIEQFIFEFDPITSLKRRASFMIFANELDATNFIDQQEVFIDGRKHLIKQIESKAAERILPILQPKQKGEEAPTTRPTSVAANARPPKTLSPLKERYDDAKKFATDFFSLINADRAAAAAQALNTNAPLKKYRTFEDDDRDDGKVLIEFWVDEEKAEKANTSFKFTKGDTIRFQATSDSGHTFESNASIVRSPGLRSSSYIAQLNEPRFQDHLQSAETITVELVFILVTFERQVSALVKLTRGGERDDFLKSIIMGQKPLQRKSLERLQQRIWYACGAIKGLNRTQKECIRMGLSYRFSIIQGPPGTGKTTTIAVLVYNLITEDLQEMVIIVSPSNTAADEACERIALAGLNPVRIYAKTIEDNDENRCRDRALHILVQREAGPVYKELKEKEKNKTITAGERDRLCKLEFAIQKRILEQSRVIVTTCATAALPIIAEVKPTTLIHDEASQATVPESLIPIMTGVKRVVLVGDQQQLPPLVLSQRAKNAGLDNSLMKRMIDLNMPSIMLTHQHRMHPDVAKYPSAAFYGNKLVNCVDEVSRAKIAAFAKLPVSTSAGFVHTEGEETRRGTSVRNEKEAEAIVRAASGLITNGVRPSEVSIISYYEAQTTLIRELIRKRLEEGDTTFANEDGEIEVANVDAFQGRENQVILISTVRSNPKGEIGFLDDYRRFNVSITRAISLLLIFGNVYTLSADATMHSMLQMYVEGGQIFEATDDGYSKATLKLPLPEPLNRSRAKHEGDDVTDEFERCITLDLESQHAPFWCELCKAKMGTTQDVDRHFAGRQHKTAAGLASIN